MDFDALRLFVTIVERRSIAAAARSFSISPSLASRRVAALERAVGARLLIRTTRSLVPTEAGTVLLDWARNAVNDWGRVRDDIGALTWASVWRCSTCDERLRRVKLHRADTGQFCSAATRRKDCSLDRPGAGTFAGWGLRHRCPRGETTRRRSCRSTHLRVPAAARCFTGLFGASSGASNPRRIDSARMPDACRKRA